MKILFIIPRLTSGGAERQSVTLGVKLKELGHDVSFLCYSKGDFFETVLNKAGIPVYRNICNYLKRILFVVRFIHKGHFNVVISFLPTPNFLNCVAAIGGKKWKVITSERSSVEKALLSRRGKLFCYLEKYSDAIVCNSDNARQMWIKHYPHYVGKLYTIYNAVTLPDITGFYTPKNHHRINIVVAATIYKTKNPMGLVNALSMMTKEEQSQIHVDWYGSTEAEIGNHEEYDNVVRNIQEMNLEDVITLHEATRDITNIMYESDFVALFSRLEGLPNAVCEAMMIGKPIIMSRCSDYRVLVEEGINGFLCDWDKPISIKDALLSAAAVPKSDLLQMGVASRQKALSLFNVDSVVSQWLDLMR